jgi:hypothetical protein
MDAFLGVLVFGGLAVLGIVALVQSATRPSGRAQPGSHVGRPSYKKTGSSNPGVPSQSPTIGAPSPVATDSVAVEPLLLDAFNRALAEVAERSDSDPLTDEQIDDLVLERSLEAVMAHLGVSRREAAEVILGVFKSGRGQGGSPLARLEAIVAGRA